MFKITPSENSYANQPCERCGSKKRVSKIWEEEVITFSGKKEILKYSQIICTNKICQAEFEERILEDEKKRAAVKVKKDANDAQRKENSLLQAQKARKKQISRI